MFTTEFKVLLGGILLVAAFVLTFFAQLLTNKKVDQYAAIANRGEVYSTQALKAVNSIRLSLTPTVVPTATPAATKALIKAIVTPLPKK